MQPKTDRGEMKYKAGVGAVYQFQGIPQTLKVAV